MTTKGFILGPIDAHFVLIDHTANSLRNSLPLQFSENSSFSLCNSSVGLSSEFWISSIRLPSLLKDELASELGLASGPFQLFMLGNKPDTGE